MLSIRRVAALLTRSTDSSNPRERVAAIYIGSAKLNGLDPEAYLREVRACIAELHPWNVATLSKVFA